MSLILEDGTGKSNSNSFADYVFADTYFGDRGAPITIWPVAGVNPLKDYALIRATDFIEASWRMQFRGIKNTFAQRLSWPRTGARLDENTESGYMLGAGAANLGYWPGSVPSGFTIPSNIVPELLKIATCELASRGLQAGDMTSVGNLAPDITAGQSSLIKQTIGPISQEWAHGRKPFTVFRFVGMLIQPLLMGGGGGSKNLIRS